jgi:hypothetical protein
MPELVALLAHVRPRFEDLRPWVDYSDAQATLFSGATNTPTEWAMLASSTLIWVAAPLIVGLQFLRRSEVK